MTIQMNIAQAKAKLSELVARAEAGEEVLIARDGKPIVVLCPAPIAPARSPRRLGIWAEYGPLTDPDLFLRADDDLEAAMDQPIFPVE